MRNDDVKADHREVLLDVLAARFSAGRFDQDHVVEESTVELLLEAAGRTPSAGNSQPWSFIVGRRGDPIHARLCAHLAPSSRAWAPEAGLLLANLAHVLVEDSELEFSEFAEYDLGQAVAHLSVQAHAMGLSVHQFRAFDRDGIAAEFDIPRHWKVTSMAAVGRPHPVDPHHSPSGLPSSTTRERLPVAAITWAREKRSN